MLTEIRNDLTQSILTFTDKRGIRSKKAIEAFEKSLQMPGTDLGAAVTQLRKAITTMGAWDLLRDSFRDMKKAALLEHIVTLIVIGKGKAIGVSLSDEVLLRALSPAGGLPIEEVAGAAVNYLVENARQHQFAEDSLTFKAGDDGKSMCQDGSFCGIVEFNDSVPVVGGLMVVGKLSGTSRARQAWERQITKGSPASLASLPQLPIGHIASYLPLRDVSTLAAINKSFHQNPEIQRRRLDRCLALIDIGTSSIISGSDYRKVQIFNQLLAVSDRLSPVNQRAFLWKLHAHLEDLPDNQYLAKGAELASKFGFAYKMSVDEVKKLRNEERLAYLTDLMKNCPPDLHAGFDALLSASDHLSFADQRDFLTKLHGRLKRLPADQIQVTGNRLMSKYGIAYKKCTNEIQALAKEDRLAYLTDLMRKRLPEVPSGFDVLLGASDHLSPADRQEFLRKLADELVTLPVNRRKAAGEAIVARYFAQKDLQAN